MDFHGFCTILRGPYGMLASAWFSFPQSWRFGLLGNLLSPKSLLAVWLCSGLGAALDLLMIHRRINHVFMCFSWWLLKGKMSPHMVEISVTNVNRVAPVTAGPCCVLFFRVYFFHALILRDLSPPPPRPPQIAIILYITKSMFYSCVNNVPDILI